MNIDYQTSIFIAGLVVGSVMTFKVIDIGYSTISSKIPILNKTNGNGKMEMILKDITETKYSLDKLSERELEHTTYMKTCMDSLIKANKDMVRESKISNKTLTQIRDAIWKRGKVT